MNEAKKSKGRFKPTPAFYEAIIIVIISILTFAYASLFNIHAFFDKLLKKVRVGPISGEATPIVFAILTLCLSMFSIRRWLEIRHEVRRRMIAEEGLRKHKDQLEDLVIERTRETLGLHKQVEFILAATKTGLDIIDSGYNMVYVDKGWQKVYGDPGGRKCYEYFMGRDSICPGCGVTKALETRKMVVTEEVLVKEGNRPVQVTTIPYQNEKGEWLVAEVNVDISERKKLEEELVKHRDRLEDLIKERTGQLIDNELRFRLIFNEAVDGLILADIDTRRFFMVNKSICDMLGYSEEEMKGLSVSDIHPENELPHILEQFNARPGESLRSRNRCPSNVKTAAYFMRTLPLRRSSSPAKNIS